MAARLGDPDAQNNLAFCLANGKGCKKDRREAAKWYRAAVSNPYSCGIVFPGSCIVVALQGSARTK